MTNLLRQERTLHSDIPLGHLEYGYIEKCTDAKEVEKIIKVLKSGEEGRYPDLEDFAEKCLAKLDPKSRLLRKDHNVSTRADVEKSEWEAIAGDLSNWTDQMKNAEGHVSGAKPTVDGEAHDLPPVRGQATISASTLQNALSKEEEKKKSGHKKNKRVTPREYKEWDKIDIDAELEKIATDETDDSVQKKEIPKKKVLSKPCKPAIPSIVDSTGMSDEDKLLKAELEKNKGNEAFRANDFQEALLYYNRSLSLMSSFAVHNNRAQTYIKLKEWDNAIGDCQTVLSQEPKNLKGLLRRAVAYQGKGHLANAKTDIKQVLKMEPGNKRATNILVEVEEALAEQKTRGRRMVIEETDGSDSESEGEAPKESFTQFTPDNGNPKSDASIFNNVQKEKEEETAPHSNGKMTESNVAQCAKSNAAKNPDFPVISEKETNEAKAEIIKTQPGISDNSNKKKKKRNKKFCPPPSPTEKAKAVINNGNPADGNKFKHGTKQNQENQPECIIKDDGPTEKTVDINADVSIPEKKQSVNTGPVEEAPLPIPPAPLPDKINSMKTAGNDLFKVGQFGEAIEKYGMAIDLLSKEKGNHTNNLHLLYGNRGLCKLKVGNCEGCVKDCNTALDLMPGSLKPLARRAQAFETMEKYRRAYVDYRQVVYMDDGVDVAQQGLNRCMKMLQQMDGPSWREKLPEVKVAHLTKSSSASQLSSMGTDSANTSTPACSVIQKETKKDPESAEPKLPSMTQDQLYDKHKAEGNSYVQKGDFTSAVACYSLCIEICPERSVAYVNRALCYLRSNKPEEVISDCTEGLRLDPGNVKALFRRSQGYKMLEKYDESYHDLTTLLKKDPKNPPARKELLVVMKYRDQAMKAKTQKQKEEEKKGRRLKIQEVSDSDSSGEDNIKVADKKPNSPRGKAKVSPRDTKPQSTKPQAKDQKGTKNTDQPPTKGNKPHPESPRGKKDGKSKLVEEMPKSESQRQKNVPQPSSPSIETPSKKPTKQPSVKQDTDIPVSTPQVTLSNATGYEFVKAWNGLRGRKEVKPYADLLDQILPTDLPKVISNKLEGDMLNMLIRCIEVFIDKGELSRSLAYLQHLVKVPRFNMVTMFMGTTEKTDLERIFGKLRDGAMCPILQEDLKKLRKAYDLS